jgi:hypothetical protein
VGDGGIGVAVGGMEVAIGPAVAVLVAVGVRVGAAERVLVAVCDGGRGVGVRVSVGGSCV